MWMPDHYLPNRGSKRSTAGWIWGWIRRRALYLILDHGRSAPAPPSAAPLALACAANGHDARGAARARHDSDARGGARRRRHVLLQRDFERLAVERHAIVPLHGDLRVVLALVGDVGKALARAVGLGRKRRRLERANLGE